MDSEMRAKLVEQANYHRERMKRLSQSEMGAFLKRLIDENDIAWGIFQDVAAPGGFGFHLIKGRRTLEAVVASGKAENLRVSAVPCIKKELAVAAEKTWGDGSVKGTE
jgi:hypothetical protein